MKTRTSAAALVASCLMMSTPGNAAVQEAVDACIDRLRAEGGPNAKAGTVLSSEFSEAGTLVMLKDRGGKVWRCIGYSDGTVGELSPVDAGVENGDRPQETDTSAGRPVAGPSTEVTERLNFAPGTSGAIAEFSLKSGEAMNYLLNARDGQFLNVRLDTESPFLFYMIYVPDGGILYESSQAGNDYRGQLYETGDHRIEVFYDGEPGTNGKGQLTITIE
ncbi:hypothetical protein [Roseibium sp. SCP14]|uniref:hypothetical protein n=1 Tax=Roseibium sp. SCP14 TaxID=3141375 RepID=UPI003338306E